MRHALSVVGVLAQLGREGARRRDRSEDLVRVRVRVRVRVGVGVGVGVRARVRVRVRVRVRDRVRPTPTGETQKQVRNLVSPLASRLRARTTHRDPRDI